MKKYIAKRIGALLSVCLLALGIHAQGFSPAALELLKQKKLWFNSQNAAGVGLDDTRKYSDLKFNYTNIDGDFKRPQEGESLNNFGVNSEGFMNLENKAFVWGKFSFEQQNIKDAQYNASITDPFRGMPYYVTDEGHLSKWRNQFYDLEFLAATPTLWNHWSFGIKGAYKASISAKQLDPRVDTRFYTLELLPGVTYKINDKHTLGINLEYASIKEDSKMENVNFYVDQQYYEHAGLGIAVNGVGNGRETDYKGDRIGAGFQYNFNGEKWRLLFEAVYTKHVEDVDNMKDSNGRNYPKRIAQIADEVMKAGLTVYRTGERFTHYLNLGYESRSIDGIEYVNQRNNSLENNNWIEVFHSIRSTYETEAFAVNYSFIQNKGGEYGWKVDAGVSYVKQDDKYLMPEAKKNYENMLYSLSIKKNFVVGSEKNQRLLVDLSGALKKNQSGEYEFNGSFPDYASVVMERTDLNYLASDYTKFGLSATYSQQIKEKSRTNIFAKAAFEHVNADSDLFSKRNTFSITVGCNF
ncbi:MAG: hypothetical protein IJ511_02335 [Bacteroides sp.]|nr:hypothetical protein [Bacteroides sp.]